MELLILLGPAFLLVVILSALAVLGERSIKRQQNSGLRRGRSERNAAGRVVEKFFRW